MDKIALNIPGMTKPVPNPEGFIATQFPDLASFVSQIFGVVIYVSIFLAFYYFIWGAFNYIMAQGQKEGIAKAKERIRWAVVGLIVILMSYTLAKFIATVFPPGSGGLPF